MALARSCFTQLERGNAVRRCFQNTWFITKAILFVNQILGVLREIYEYFLLTKSRVLREINKYNSDGSETADLLKMRLAVCVHDQHPFYNEFTTNKDTLDKYVATYHHLLGDYM